MTVSTVGFKTATGDLACVAEAAGGLFVTADDTKQLVARITAARSGAELRNDLSTTGMAGVQIGTPHQQIMNSHTGFPILAGARTEGDLLVVTWRDCDWAFTAEGKLYEIRPHGEARAVEGLAPGQPLSRAEDLYGAPVETHESEEGPTLLYPASREAGTPWRGLRRRQRRPVPTCRETVRSEDAGG